MHSNRHAQQHAHVVSVGTMYTVVLHLDMQRDPTTLGSACIGIELCSMIKLFETCVAD